MVIIGLLIFFGIPIALIGIGYYLDYKKDKKYFLSGMKGALKGIIIFLISLIASTVFGWLNEMIFPLNKNYGLSQNSVRKEIGIPIIGDLWIKQPRWGNQYREWYTITNTDSTFKHQKKKIEYDIWGAINEEDYFESPNNPVKLISRYDYSTNQVSYFKVEPLPLKEQNIIDGKGKVILNRETESEIELDKCQFETELNNILMSTGAKK